MPSKWSWEFIHPCQPLTVCSHHFQVFYVFLRCLVLTGGEYCHLHLTDGETEVGRVWLAGGRPRDSPFPRFLGSRYCWCPPTSWEGWCWPFPSPLATSGCPFVWRVFSRDSTRGPWSAGGWHPQGQLPMIERGWQTRNPFPWLGFGSPHCGLSPGSWEVPAALGISPHSWLEKVPLTGRPPFLLPGQCFRPSQTSPFHPNPCLRVS